MARNTGGPALGLVQATVAMGSRIDRSIYCTDAAQPAASQSFVRLTPDALPRDAAKIDLRVFPTRHPRRFGYSPALFRAIGASVGETDLLTIHSLNLFPQLAAYIHARRTRTPYIVTPHGSLDPWLRKNSPAQKAVVNFSWQSGMLARASAIHFTTEDEATLAGDVAPGVPRYIVPNGVQIREFQDLPDGRQFREQFLGGHSGPVILFLSRIAQKKGIDILLSSFRQATGMNDALLVIVGPDDENLTPSLQRQADAEGISGRVRFLGPLYDEQRRAALSAADLWALTSHTENFGNAVLEAMAAGLPVIISTAVNIAPQVKAARAGVVTSLRVAEVATHLSDLLAAPEDRQRLGERARAFATEYDWSTIASRLVAMYGEVVAKSSVSSFEE